MTYAWYGHLRNAPPATYKSMILLILLSWGIAFFEYIFMVPANNYYARLEGFTPFQLKMIQEVITLVVFFCFALFFLKENFRWNYVVSFVLIMAATYFMFLPNQGNP
ncbi:MAG: DMT family protein [Neisseria sp.]|nr:DMT family protein [Neisseria sp.]